MARSRSNNNLTAIFVFIGLFLIFVIFVKRSREKSSDTADLNNGGSSTRNSIQRRHNKNDYIDERLRPPSPVLPVPSFQCKDVRFLVAVHTRLDGFENRNQWRQNYAKLGKKFGYKLVFPLGRHSNDSNFQKKLEAEASQHNDILQLDYVDTYRNLTQKHLSLLRFFVDFCSKDAVLVKVDDDVVWHIEKVSVQVSNMNGHHLICHDFNKWPVHRNPRNKWFLTKEEYTSKYFPHFCGGFAYMMSYEAARRIERETRYAEFLWVDDAFITGILKEPANISITSKFYEFVHQEGKTGKLLKENKTVLFALERKEHVQDIYKILNAHLLLEE